MPFSLSNMFRPSGALTTAPKHPNAQPQSSSSSSSSSSTSSPAPPSSSLSGPSPLSDSLTLLVAFLQSPLWSVPLSTFIDANCLYFDTATEHQLQHTTIHHSYVQLCESLLSAHLDAVGLSHDSFVTVCELGLQSTDGTVRRLVGEVLLLDDYVLFHKRMVQRNVELDAQVLADCLAVQNKQKNKDKQRERQRAAHSDSRRQQSAAEEEDDALRMAIQLSLLEEESDKRQREREAAEIEYAISLSLALQAEELRQAEEMQRAAEHQQRQQEQPQSQQEQQHEDKQPKGASVEEEKEAVSSIEPPAVPFIALSSLPVTSSSVPSVASVALAPLKNLRRAYESNMQRVEAAREERAAAAAAATTDATDGRSVQEQQQQAVSSEAELAARQQFLRLQRERLIARNKEAGTKQLSAFKADLADTEQAVKQQLQSDAVSAAAAVTARPTAAVDAKRAAMQAVLKARLREEADKTIASRTEQRSLDEQLQMLQNLAL